MGTLCCYTARDPAEDGRFHLHSSQAAGLESVRRHAPGADMVDVTGDEFAYWREISARWTGAEDLIVVEHDMLIGPDTVPSLSSCQADWCAFGYDIFGCKRIEHALGCTKFSAALQRAVPAETVAALFSHCEHCRGDGCWWHLDNYLAAALAAAGFGPHVHGDVAHLHDYGPPGTIPLSDGIMSVFSWEAGQEPVQYHVAAPASPRA